LSPSPPSPSAEIVKGTAATTVIGGVIVTVIGGGATIVLGGPGGGKETGMSERRIPTHKAHIVRAPDT